MKMRGHKPKGTPLALVLIGWLILVACGSGTSTETGPPAVDAPSLSSTNISAPADESVAGELIGLVYNPNKGSFLKARTGGLFRWGAEGEWESVALPQAASLSSVIINPEQPETVYISGTDLGVVRSDDGGKSWQPVNSGLPTVNVTALAIHSFRRETLYAWLDSQGIYRTEDGGENWVRVPDQGPPDQDVSALAHSTLPGSMNTGWLYASTPTGAYLSMDCF